MSDIVDKEKFKIDAGLQYLPTDLTYELRMAVTGHQKDEFLSWGYHWEDKPHRLVYAACREVEAQAVTITRLTEENERLRAALQMFACDCAVHERCAVPDNCRNFQARRTQETRHE
jgi:hypothetical protein